MSYQLHYQVPYEGYSVHNFGTLEEVKNWLKKNKSSYEYDLYNVTVLIIAGEVDVYDLMKDKE